MQNRTPPPDYTLNCNPIPMVNTTSDTIPPGGILANVGNPDDEGRKRVGKPTSDGQTGCYVNGPYSVPPPDVTKGIVGAGWCSFSSPIRAAYNPLDGTPAVGETWGPVSGSFLLGKNKPGFKIDGEASPDEGTVPVVRLDVVGEVNVKITGAIASGLYPAVYTTRVIVSGMAVSYTDGSNPVRVVVLGGGTLENGKRYRGQIIGIDPASGTFPLVEVRGDANYTALSGSDETAWAGGLISTEAQSIKGAKSLRDTLKVASDPGGVARVELNPTTLGSSVAHPGILVAGSANSAGFGSSYTGPVTGIPDPTSGTILVSQNSTTAFAIVHGLPSSYNLNTSLGNSVTGSMGSNPAATSNLADVLAASGVGWVLSPNHGLFSGFITSYGGFAANYYGSPGPPGGEGFPGFPGWASGQGDSINLATYTTNNFKMLFLGGIYLGRLYGGGASPAPPPPPIPPAQGQIKIAAFRDSDASGVWDDGKLPAAGSILVLSGPQSASAVVGEDGWAFFEDLAPGSYLVSIVRGPNDICEENADAVVVTADTETEIQRAIVQCVPGAVERGGILVVVQQLVGSTCSPLSREVTYSGESTGGDAGRSVYCFLGLPVGDYAVTVVPDGGDSGTWAWTVDDPADSGSGETTDDFTIAQNEKTVVTFTLTPPGGTYSISGNVLVDGSPSSEISITLSGDASAVSETDIDGNYIFTGLDPGTYNVAPTSIPGGQTWVPTSITGITIVAANITGQDFAVTTA